MLLVYFSFLLVYKLTYLQHKHELLVVQGVELGANYMVNLSKLSKSNYFLVLFLAN